MDTSSSARTTTSLCGAKGTLRTCRRELQLRSLADPADLLWVHPPIGAPPSTSPAPGGVLIVTTAASFPVMDPPNHWSSGPKVTPAPPPPGPSGPTHGIPGRDGGACGRPGRVDPDRPRAG